MKRTATEAGLDVVAAGRGTDQGNENDRFTYWADDMLPELRDEVRRVLHAQNDYATLTALRMTSTRERDDTKAYFKATRRPRRMDARTFVARCHAAGYYALMVWAMRIHPSTTLIHFDSYNKRPWSPTARWETDELYAIGPAIPENSEDDI